MVPSNRMIAMVSVLAVLVLWETGRPFFDQFAHAPAKRVVHIFRNLLVAGFNAAVVSLGFVALWAWAASYAQQHEMGLLYLWQLPGWLHAALAVLLLDGWTYWWHRWNHVVPVLWRFHRTHHSDTQMDVTTAGRFHLGEIAMSSTLRIGLILLLGVGIADLVLYEVLMFAVVQFHHANVGLPAWLDRAMRVLIVTPAMHKVHHSDLQKETDSNYTSMFSFWDRLFGTFRHREDLENIRFGVQGYDCTKLQSIKGIAVTPFADQLLMEKSSPPPSSRSRIAAVVLFLAAICVAIAGCIFLPRDQTPDQTSWQQDSAAWQNVRHIVARDFPNTQTISTQQLATWLDDPARPQPVLLDARETEEFAVSHLKGARRIDPDADASDLPSDIHKDTPVVVYCSVGYRSAGLTQRLHDAGYSNVVNLEGSIFKWVNEQRPLVRGNEPVQQVHPYDSQWGKLVAPQARAAETK